MVRSKVDGTYDFIIEKIREQLTVNGQQSDLDILQLDDTNYHIIHKNKSYQVTITGIDIVNKKFEVRVNNRTYQVEHQDENDLLLEKMGLQQGTIKTIDELRAPMPGLIANIYVQEGQKVEDGQPLIVLKAMKMENVLKSPHEGIIKKIFVEEHQKIEKDAVIIQF